MKRLCLLLLLLACAPGCTSRQQPTDLAGQLTPVQTPKDPAVVPLPDPEAQGGHVGRAPRRLTVAQLKASIQVATGRQWSQIDTLAASLGKADYALVNTESTEPNLVFAKFLEDGAREVCLATATADGARPAAERVLSPEVPQEVTDPRAVGDAVVRKNLVYLSTRFWGSPLAGAELDRWAGAFPGMAARAMAINKREQAWGTLCIALMTDPRFLSY